MVKDEIAKILRGEVYDDEETLAAYSEDTSIFHMRPALVVAPRDAEDVGALVRFAASSEGRVSLTARAAGTDMTGGPLTDSVVVDFLPHFNRILEVTDDGCARVQPGVFYRDFEKATLAKNWLLPCYTASRDLNTVGGMVANNSGGEKSLAYGKTERYVRALKVVLSDGNEYTFSRLSREEWERKKAQQDFEGEIYRALSALVESHDTLLQRHKPRVSKNSAGYALWNLWDKQEDSFDLTQLFVGSQGTLGLITEIEFALVRPKKEAAMLVLFLRKRHMRDLGALVNEVLSHGPESFESYDDHTLRIALRVLPDLMRRLGRGPFGLMRDFLPEVRMVLTGGMPYLILLAEFTGDDRAEVMRRAQRAEARLRERFNVATHVTRNDYERNKYWTIRRESFKLLREHVHGKHTAPFIDDIAVAPAHLPEFLPRLYAIMDEYRITYTIAGHIGDGNFHIIPLMNFKRPDFQDIIQELSERVYALVLEYGGTITGEHNDGIIRTPYLEKMYGAEVAALFAKVKDLMDPQRIFNPHKKVDPDPSLIRTALKHE